MCLKTQRLKRLLSAVACTQPLGETHELWERAEVGRKRSPPCTETQHETPPAE